jgi:hypothetical protein
VQYMGFYKANQILPRVPVRSKNWSVSQKHPQKAISILLTF